MKKKLSIIVLSLLISLITMAIGYSSWEDVLIIKGHLTITDPIEIKLPKTPEKEEKSSTVKDDDKAMHKIVTENGVPVEVIQTKKTNGEYIKDNAIDEKKDNDSDPEVQPMDKKDKDIKSI